MRRDDDWMERHGALVGCLLIIVASAVLWFVVLKSFGVF